MNCQEVWDRACLLLKDEMNEVSYNTWIKDSLKPRQMNGDQFFLETVTDFKRKMILRYADLISNAVTAAAGHQMAVQMLTPQEAVQLLQREEPEEETVVCNQLNPKYTFDTFVVGKSNSFAQAAALAVAETPADAFNPLFIYGGVGLGKTHLMHAIGHFIQQAYPSMRLLYTSSESFTNELISAIQKKKNAEFRNRYRNVDVLMIDDIQFFANRDSTQEEFFHTFNALHMAHKQIIISSDKLPKEIPKLEERLVSRFEWGLATKIDRPDVDTRTAILRKRAESDRVQVEDAVLKLIAERVDSNIRELEGSLTRVVAYATLAGRPVTLTLAEEALRDIISIKDPRRTTCPLIQQMVADYYRVNVQDMQSAKRHQAITLPRQVAMFLTREMTDLSLPRIGAAFGGRDHSTVIHACDKIADDIQQSPSLRAAVEELRKTIREK